MSHIKNKPSIGINIFDENKTVVESLAYHEKKSNLKYDQKNKKERTKEIIFYVM